MLIFSIVLNVIIVVSVFIAIFRMLAAIKAFDALIMKFIQINQQFYENQKLITIRTTDLLKVMANENSGNKNMVSDIRRMSQDQSKHTGDTYVAITKLNADVKLLSNEIKKIIHASAILSKNK